MDSKKKDVVIEIKSKRYSTSESFFESMFDEPKADIFSANVKKTEEEDSIDMTSEGILEFKNNRVIIRYDESELTGMEGATTEVSFDKSRPNLISMIRTGCVSTILVFEEGVRHICTYKTEYMPFEICVKTKKVENNILTDGTLHLDYAVEIRGAKAERTVFDIKIH